MNEYIFDGSKHTITSCRDSACRTYAMNVPTGVIVYEVSDCDANVISRTSVFIPNVFWDDDEEIFVKIRK